mgnify:CR=1 FL=1
MTKFRSFAPCGRIESGYFSSPPVAAAEPGSVSESVVQLDDDGNEHDCGPSIGHIYFDCGCVIGSHGNVKECQRGGPIMSVVVSRHPAAIEFIAAQLGGVVSPRPSDRGGIIIPDDPGCLSLPVEQWSDRTGETYIPVLASADAEDVRRRVVYGNLPMLLASLASEVHAIEFDGPLPRGQEHSLADMVAAGAVLRKYRVTRE